jgi:hypothetical protein
MPTMAKTAIAPIRSLLRLAGTEIEYVQVVN